MIFIRTKYLLFPFIFFPFVSFVLANDIAIDDKPSNIANKRINETTLIVTAELEDKNVLAIPSSVSVISQASIENRNAQQLTDILNLAPNVNFATGASRGRFIQIRGVGERSEFIEPVNYSVGVVLDGIDLTGISTVASTLDVQQVEILRGPQGTLYGANGLAGLINIVSNSPTENFYSKLSATFESFSGQEITAIISGPASDKLGYRFAVKQYKSDGTINNLYLNRDNTNNIDELSFRGRFFYQLNDDLQINTSLFFANANNGYDAFSLDNNRNTLSDQPGQDKQKTNAIAVNINWDINPNYWLESIVSLADSDLDYGYDEDWSNPYICDNTDCDSSLWGFDWWYSSFDRYQRKNKNTTVDIKLHSVNEQDDNAIQWVAGFYFRDQQIDLRRQYTYSGEDFTSQFNSKNTALYGQISIPLSQQFLLTSGLRYERRQSDYFDSLSATFKPKEDLWGGKLALEYHLDNNKMFYGLISRGYKAGGFNAAEDIPEGKREYLTEFMWNYETGIKGNFLDHQLVLQAAIFYQARQDIQSKQSLVRSQATGELIQQGGDCPCSFTDVTDNAAAGNSSGLEVEIQWYATQVLKLYSSLGLLKSEYTDFKSFTHVDADLESIPPIPFNLKGREFAQSPRYQWLLGGDLYLSEQWTFNAEVESKDSFYFSDRHQQQSDSYQQFNARLTYQNENYRLHFYANNITNETIQTRAFASFGNDPRNFYQTEAYFQLAAPRVIGVSISTEFE